MLTQMYTQHLPKILSLEAVLGWLAGQGPAAIAATNVREDGLLWRYWRGVLDDPRFAVADVQWSFSTVLTALRVHDVPHMPRLTRLVQHIDTLAYGLDCPITVADVLATAYAWWPRGGVA